ncbi:MAG: efflux RND transporter periplasmic adaptor subunit, partial [Planctomycetota bacterium]
LRVTVTENGMLESSNNKEIKCLVKGGSTVLWVIETGTIVEPGDELVRLDQSQIEDNILAQEIIYENALANKITAESDVAVAKTSITEYLEGTYVEERSTIEKEIFDAEQELTQAELNYKSSVRMAAKGLIKTLQLNGEKFSVESARKGLELKRTQLEALEKYKKQKELQTLQSTLRAAEARLASFDASLRLEEARLNRERKQLENCVIKADVAGMVIFPSMADWKSTPDIEEGAVVREQQTLLMIPDVSQMQVKVGIHESKVDRLQIGMPARIELQGLELQGEVAEIAEVTKPAGWWTGNLVKYDTIIKLEQHEGLKPGMSALVDVVLAKYEDVLTIPVAAILEHSDGHFCWIETENGVQRRKISLGDTDDEFSVVTAGLASGDKVLLNPLAHVQEAKDAAMKPVSGQEDESEIFPDNKRKSSERSANSTGDTKPKSSKKQKDS